MNYFFYIQGIYVIFIIKNMGETFYFQGIYVTYIHDEGPAARCGLTVHDKILQVLSNIKI